MTRPIAFAAPVAYKMQPDAKAWTLGTLVYTDGTTAWLQGATRVAVAGQLAGTGNPIGPGQRGRGVRAFDDVVLGFGI